MVQRYVQLLRARARLGERPRHVGRLTNRALLAVPATVAAMRVMLAHEVPTKASARQIDVMVNGESTGKPALASDDTTYALAELGTKVRDGHNLVRVVGAKGGDIQYQLLGSYFVPWDAAPPAASGDALSLEVVPDRTEVSTGDEIALDLTVTWRGSRPIRMPMLEVGVPPSMEVVTEGLDALRDAGTIELWGRSERHVLLYLPLLTGTKKLRVRLRTRYAARVKLPATRVYAYYDPDVLVEVPPIDVRVE